MKFMKMKNYRNPLILVFVIVVCVILLGMCISQIYQSNDLSTRNIPAKPIPQKIHVSLQITDSIALADSTMIAKMDSAINIMRTWNNYCDENLMYGLDDLRQETNNVINKQNGWLSFWVAILTLIGALLPLVIQLNTQQKIDSEIEGLNKKSQDLENTMLFSEISKLSFTLINCANDKWVKNSSNRNDIINGIFDDICKNTNGLISTIKRNNALDDVGNRTHIKMVLMQLYTTYTTCELILSTSYKIRRLSKLKYDISTILGKLCNNSFSTYQDFYNDLDEVQEQMNLFRL